MEGATISTKERILEAARRRVLAQGLTATTIDAVLADAGASKGAFFHHFSSKEALGEELIRRYAEADAATLERAMHQAEVMSDDPAHQLVEFVRYFEQPHENLIGGQPGCLFASFVYEQIPGGRSADKLFRESIQLWRDRIVEKLHVVTASGPLTVDVDIMDLADHLFVTFEGAFILARATGKSEHISAHVKQFRIYLELLLAPHLESSRS